MGDWCTRIRRAHKKSLADLQGFWAGTPSTGTPAANVSIVPSRDCGRNYLISGKRLSYPLMAALATMVR